MIAARNLHAGMRLAERDKGKLVGRQICELHADRKVIKVRVYEKEGFGDRKFKRMQMVRIWQ
jgi:hypothetical protein